MPRSSKLGHTLLTHVEDAHMTKSSIETVSSRPSGPRISKRNENVWDNIGISVRGASTACGALEGPPHKHIEIDRSRNRYDNAIHIRIKRLQRCMFKKDKSHRGKRAREMTVAAQAEQQEQTQNNQSRRTEDKAEEQQQSHSSAASLAPRSPGAVNRRPKYELKKERQT